MNRRIVIPIITAVLLVGVASIAATNLAGRYHYIDVPYHYPVGTVKTCGKGCRVTTDAGNMFTTQGKGAATWINNSPADAIRPWAEVQITTFTAIGDDPELGPIAFYADNTRPQISRIESNVDGAAFPATFIHISHVTGTIGGVEYRSITPIVGTAIVDANQWPHNNVTYTQVGTTDLERVDNPGVVALTLHDIQAVVNALD